MSVDWIERTFESLIEDWKSRRVGEPKQLLFEALGRGERDFTKIALHAAQVLGGDVVEVVRPHQQ